MKLSSICNTNLRILFAFFCSVNYLTFQQSKSDKMHMIKISQLTIAHGGFSRPMETNGEINNNAYRHNNLVTNLNWQEADQLAISEVEQGPQDF